MTQLATVGDLIQQTKRLLTGSRARRHEPPELGHRRLTGGIPLDFDPGGAACQERLHQHR